VARPRLISAATADVTIHRGDIESAAAGTLLRKLNEELSERYPEE
jgi:hypothetical protein